MLWFDDTQAELEVRIEESETFGVSSNIVDADKVVHARKLREELKRELERVKRWRALCEGTQVQ